MSGQDRFERFLSSLHAAALDDGLWPAASGLIDEVCGSKGNILVSGEGGFNGGVDLFFVRALYRGQRRAELEREYFEVYHPVDERMPRLRQLADSRIVHVDALFTGEEKKASPVYNEMMPRSDTGNCLHARLDGPDGSRIAWTVADPVDGEGWTSERVETVGRLLPHLRRFVRVREARPQRRSGRRRIYEYPNVQQDRVWRDLDSAEPGQFDNHVGRQFELEASPGWQAQVTLALKGAPLLWEGAMARSSA